MKLIFGLQVNIDKANGRRYDVTRYGLGRRLPSARHVQVFQLLTSFLSSQSITKSSFLCIPNGIDLDVSIVSCKVFGCRRISCNVFDT